MAAKTFNSDWIEASKKVLFELCPTTQRNVSHKGPQKDVNNIKSCLKVMNECGKDVPRFVSHYLDELPPVSFDSIDVSSLLGRMEQLSAELCSMKHALQLHVNVCEDLRVITVDINRRVCALEQSTDSTQDGGSEVSAATFRDTRIEGTALGAALVETLETGIGEGAAVARSLSLNAQRVESAVTMEGTTGLTSSSDSPKWSRVVKKGRRQGFENPAVTKSRSLPVILRQKKKSGNVMSVVGTGAVGNIRMVKTKLVSVFVSKFTPDLDALTLSEYLKEKLGRDVACQKIETVQSRYSSFKVSAECNEVSEMYDLQLWPEGAFVRRYYEPRRVGVIGSNSAPVVGESVRPRVA